MMSKCESDKDRQWNAWMVWPYETGGCFHMVKLSKL